jgi:hypothetical protein
VQRENIEGLLDRRRQWSFSLSESDGCWRWHRSNRSRSETQSSQPFSTLDDCIADAMKHGYVVWEEKDRRRPEFPGWDD